MRQAIILTNTRLQQSSVIKSYVKFSIKKFKHGKTVKQCKRQTHVRSGELCKRSYQVEVNGVARNAIQQKRCICKSNETVRSEIKTSAGIIGKCRQTGLRKYLQDGLTKMPEKSLANERFLLRENTSEAQQSQFQKNLGIFDEHKFHFESHNTKSAITHQAGARAVNEAEAELHNCDQTQTKEQTSTQQQAVIYNKSAMPQERPNCVQRKTQQDRKIKTLPTDVATLNPTQQRYYKKPRWSLQHCNTKERRTQTKMLTNYRSQAVVPDQANLVQQNAVNLAVNLHNTTRDQLRTNHLLTHTNCNHKLTRFSSKHFPTSIPMHEWHTDVNSANFWFCYRTTNINTYTSDQQQAAKHPRNGIQTAAARFHNQAAVRTNKHTELQHKSFATIPIKLLFLAFFGNWRDWFFRCAATRQRIQPQRPARPHIATAATFCVNAITSSTSSTSTTSANQLHTKRLRARRLPGLLFISTLLLFLLSALPSVHAACRKEPARTCESICTPGSLNCTLRALLLLPDDNAYTASMCRTMPVLDLADQYIRENSLLPPQVNLEWMTGDVKCDAAYASIKAMDGIVKNCAHVVFGPVCDYALAAVSRIAKYFNSNGTPVISIGGATDSFEDKKTTCADEFYMLVRAGVLSFKSLSLMIIELMKRYNWSNSIAFYERDGQSNIVGEHSCYLMMKSFGDEMRNLNLTFAQYSIVPELRNRTEELVREIGNKHTTLGTNGINNAGGQFSFTKTHS